MRSNSQRQKDPPGVPIFPPRHGDILPDERRTPTSNRGRTLPFLSPISLGKDTLNQERANRNSYNTAPVPATQFYSSQNTPRSSATYNLRDERQQPYRSTDRGKKIKELDTPPAKYTHTPQHRNGSANGINQRRSMNAGMKGGDREEVVISSDSEIEVEESTPLRQQKASTSLSPEVELQARSNLPRQEKNISQIETSSVRASALGSSSRDVLKQAPPLEKLAEKRTMHIAVNEDDDISEGIDPRLQLKSAQTHTGSLLPISRSMSSRYGRARSNLGSAYSSKTLAKRDKARPLLDEPREASTRKHLKLMTVNLFEVGFVQADNGDPRMDWSEKGDVRVFWVDNGKRMSIEISIDDVEECLICHDMNHPTIVLRVFDKEKYTSMLGQQIGKNMFTYMEGKTTTTPEITFFMPNKTNQLFNLDGWLDLLEILQGSQRECKEIGKQSYTLVKSVVQDIPLLLRSGNPDQKGANAKKVNPSMSRRSTNGEAQSLARDSPVPTRTSQRQMGKGTESDEEAKAIQESIEQAAKNKPYIDPSKVRLHYPFDEARGLQAVQADIERLDDREFLNDTIIEIGLKYLLKEIKDRDPELHSQIYVFSSFFYKLISEGKRDRKTAYEAVKRWTTKVDIFEKKYLVVPINEKMHWYLAILLNPYYAVREYEGRGNRSLEVEDETLEEDVDELATATLSLPEGESGEAQEMEDSVEEVKDTEGDTTMESEEKEEGELSSDRMEVDAITGGLEGIFKDAASEEELLQGYRPSSRRFSVIDKRGGNTKKPSVDGDEEGDYTVVSVNMTPTRHLPRKSQAGRPGISDGFSAPAKTKELLGGGPSAIPIIPGESFKDDEVIESEKNTTTQRKRKYGDDDEDYQESSRPPSRAASRPPSRATSPMRNRSGMTMTRSVSSQREETQQKYQRWLQEEAVVCVFDSLGGRHKAVSNAMRDYIWLEYNDKKGGEMTVEDVHLEHIDVNSPTQGNFCDCGLYLLHAFERFFNDPELMVTEVLARRGGELHEHWQEKEAAKKREWWRNRILSLADEWEKMEELKKSEKKGSAKKRKKGNAARVERHLEGNNLTKEAQAIPNTSSEDSESSSTPTSDLSTKARGTDPVVDI